MYQIWFDEFQELDRIKISVDRLDEKLKSPILRRTKNFIHIGER